MGRAPGKVIDTIELARGQRALAWLWYAWSAPLVLLVLAQSTLGRYGTRFEEAWAWLLPTLSPTLALITGVLVKRARQDATPRSVSRFAYRVTLSLSAFYLALVSLSLLLAPFAQAADGLEPLELLRKSHLWLGPVQGLVAGALGAFFVERRG
jgi:hypothetical protein